MLLSTAVERPLKNAPFCPISVSGSNFNPRNTQCIPSVKIIAFLELDQNRTFFKGLVDSKNLNLGLNIIASSIIKFYLSNILIILFF